MRAYKVDIAFLLIILVYVTISISVSLTKMPSSDEAWFASPAINLVREGRMGVTVKEATGTLWLRMDEHTYWQPPMHFLAQAAWYRIFGVGLLSGRFLSTLWGILALVSVFFILKILTKSEFTALLGALLLAVDHHFINSATDIRMDMMCVAFALAGYASYLLLREKNLSAAMLIGNTGIAISGFTHPHGIVHFVGFVVLVVYLDRKNIRLNHVILGIIPYLAGAIGWGLYILQDPEAFRVQFLEHVMRTVSAKNGIFGAIKREVVERYLYGYGIYSTASLISRARVLILIGYILGVVGAVAQMRKGRKRNDLNLLLILLMLYIVLQTFLIGEKSQNYLVHALPFYAMILATTASQFLGGSRITKTVTATALVIFVLLQLGISARSVLRDDYRSVYLPIIKEIGKLDTGTNTIMGSGELAFRLGFRPEFVDDPALGYFSGREPDVIVVTPIYEDWFEVFERQRPDLYEYIRYITEEECEVVCEGSDFKIYRRLAHDG